MYTLLTFLYEYLSPAAVKYFILLATLLIGIYFLRPLYYSFTSKRKEKAELNRLHDLLIKNINHKNDVTTIEEPYENMTPKPLPRVIKEIALITSENGAGLNDFKEILRCGHFTLYPTGMNENFPNQLIVGVIEHIQMINAFKNADIICITRGGGSELSEIFNSFELATAIKASNIPVLIGIGHATDRLLCDKVSDSPIYSGHKRYFITPTDLAYFLNEYNEKQIQDTRNKLLKLSQVPEQIEWTLVIIYLVILYSLNKSFFHFVK